MNLESADLRRFPRVTLAHLPTPLEEMKSLGRAFGGPRLFVKRDDCTGLAFGGNKTRKLEFALGDARAKGADMIITSGGVQSNHVRQTAAAAASLGLACHAVVVSPLENPSEAYMSSGNLLLDRIFGAELHLLAADAAGLDDAASALANELRKEGGTPYVVPLGASYGIGALGYVEAARELLEQCEAAHVQPSHVVLATGSAGTHGGLLAGLRRLGAATQVIGISVSGASEPKRALVRDIVAQTAALFDTDLALADEDIVVRDEWVGPGYGVATAEGLDAIHRVARAEGILLDPVYTGKAMAGMLALLEEGRLGDARDVVFLHTGGGPGLFAYPDEL